MKKAAIISSKKQALDISSLVDAYIVPLKSFSINYDKVFTIDDISRLKKLNKEIFVSINKNIHNDELDDLIKILKEIQKLNVDGIIFYDIALVNIKKNYHLKTPLVWAQEHMTTNYGTINYWASNGAEYAFLSSELTKREIDEIREKTDVKLFAFVFGYLPMFTSRRNLVDNYKRFFNISSSNGNFTISKEGKVYPIMDKKEGTTVYSNYILNAIDEDFSKIDYVVYNSYLIDDDSFIRVLKGEDIYPKNLGFLYQETVYKVRKD